MSAIVSIFLFIFLIFYIFNFLSFEWFIIDLFLNFLIKFTKINILIYLLIYLLLILLLIFKLGLPPVII